MTALEDLLQQCTVKIIIPGGWGTGFFVAPAWILTCAHVVQAAGAQAIQVRWQTRDLEARVERSLSDPYDLALLRVVLPDDANPPCVYLGEEVQSRDPLYLFGYPDEGDRQGEPRTFNCDGITGSEIAAILFNLGQVRPGMSGSPLLNQRTGQVCGMVKFTRDRSSDLGGGAIPTRVILEQFPQLRDLQREFHGQNPQWLRLVTETIASSSPNPSKPPETDFQPYLRAIANHYTQQRNLYTPTDALLPLEARSVERQEGEDRQEKKVEQFPVLAGLRKYALGKRREHVLLAGRPGSGKSTALRQLAVGLAEEAIQNPDLPIPVLVQLKADRSVPELIQAEFRRAKQRVTSEQIDDWLLDDRLILLLDGVNEVPTDNRRQALALFREDNLSVPMVFTTRDLAVGGDRGIGKRLEMQPLSPEQMKVFVSKYLPEHGEQLLRQLRDRLRELAKTPLLLKMLCDVFDPETGQIPQSKGELFRLFDRQYEEFKGLPAVSADFRRFKSETLQHLAFVMMQGDDAKPTEFELTIERSTAERTIEQWLVNRVSDPAGKAKEWLEDLLEHHLLQVAADQRQVEFHHQLFQEYYAAEYFLKLLPNLTDEQLKRDYLNYLKWTEPVALMLSLLEENSEQAKHLRDLAWDVDWNLWINLARKTNSRPQESSLDNLFGRRWLDEDNVQSLLKKLNSRVRYLCTEAAENLKFNASDSISKSERANFDSVIESLISLIEGVEKSQDRGREEATQILVKLGSEECIPTLLEILDEDPDTFVRIDAAWALEKLGSEECVPTLLRVFNNADDHFHFLRSSAARALVEIGSKASIQGIINATDHSDPEIRRCAAWAIGFSNSETAIPVLLKAIEDVNSEVHCWAVRSLGGFESEVAIQSIFKALEDSSSTVRRAAIKALMKTNSEMKTSELTKAINDSDEHVRFEVAKALAELGSEVAIPELLQVMKKWMPCAGEVIRALGEINSEASLLELIKLFDLPEYDDRLSLQFGGMICPGEPIHRVVANVLSEVNINSESLALELINAVDNSEPMIRESIGKLLKNITFKGAVPKLEQLIHHSDLNIRKGVIEALGNIGSEATVRKLIEVIEDPLPEIRSIAVKALAKLDFKPVIPTLLRAAEDSDFYVRANAITGLGEIGSEDAVLVLSKIIDEPNREYDRAEYDIFNFDKNPNSVIRGEAVTALGRIASKDAIEVLLKAIGHTNGYVRESVARVFEEINCEVAIKYLSRLQEIHRSTGWYEASKAIASIQNRCQFYNYEIFQAHLAAQKADRTASQPSDRPITYEVNAEVVQIVENNYGTIHGKQTP